MRDEPFEITLPFDSQSDPLVGHPATWSLLVYSRDGVQVVPLRAAQRVVVGRELPADIALRDGNLSRQHAQVTLIEGEPWVEDLGSTNGTFVNGKRVERCAVGPNDAIAMGGVALAVHLHESRAAGPGVRGLPGHEQFRLLLKQEVARARFHGRPLALLLFRGDGALLARSVERIQRLLRPVDQMAIYSADTIELCLPETAAEAASQLARQVLEGEEGQPLRGGLALLPRCGSADELIEHALRGLRVANAQQPLASADLPGGPTAATEQPLVESPAMVAVYQTVERLATSAIPVLIIGETGVGKEMIARAIHWGRGQGGGRRDGALCCVNCGAIPRELIDSVLFGHERGAFTGAERQHAGLFEEADGGTVLLDEIGELPPAAQTALLRVLESKRIRRVGSSEDIAVDVRILAATHRDLEQMCEAGQFRWDLLYRINAMTLKIPPLRERPEEIELLAQHFREQANEANGRAVRSFDPPALALLQRYLWPGNVRELRNVIERAVVVAESERITAEDLPERLRLTLPDVVDLRTMMQRYERELIVDALRRCAWNQTRAAERLGLPRRTLVRKIQAYALRRREMDTDD